jgi:hypothetical protein
MKKLLAAIVAGIFAVTTTAPLFAQEKKKDATKAQQKAAPKGEAKKGEPKKAPAKGEAKKAEAKKAAPAGQAKKGDGKKMEDAKKGK